MFPDQPVYFLGFHLQRWWTEDETRDGKRQRGWGRDFGKCRQVVDPR